MLTEPPAETGTNYYHSVGYEYDTKNNLTNLVENINGTERTSSYTYDDDNRLTVSTNGAVSTHYYYDDFGRVEKQETKQNGTLILTEYYTFTATTSGTSAQVATYRTVSAAANGYDVTYTYTYDDNGNILTVNDGTITTTYAYDSANQLVGVTTSNNSHTASYSYDASGNIISKTVNGITTPYSYTDNEWKDLLTSYSGQANTYDGIGNPTQYVRDTLQWSGRQLEYFESGQRGEASYQYNADGIRIQKIIDDSQVTNYFVNGSTIVGEQTGDNVIWYTYDGYGEVIGFTYNGTPYYYVKNIQGDVCKIVDANGTVVGSYTYNAWGQLLSINGQMAGVNHIRYRSYYYDTESGYYYLQSRYYDPNTGRFLNADAFVTTGQGFIGNNMYAYCGNNPVHRADYGGESWIVIGLIIVGGLLITSLTGCSSNNESYGGSANCYAYAMNQEVDPVTHNTFSEKPQPGSFSGDPLTSDDIKTAHKKGGVDAVEAVIMSKVEADCTALGYYVREVKSPSYISHSGWVIALAYQSEGGYDYHFYKKQNSTIWTHKPGTGDIMQWDFSYGTITDPANCDRGKYDTFVGYYEIMPNIFQ